jgi:[ribosomal protein S5]-alanine N-acetyltransferase
MAIAAADILTERLRLVLISDEMCAALIDGDRAEAERLLGAAIPAWYPDDRELVGYLPRQLKRLREMPERAAWMARFLVVSDGAECAGHAGFHGPPEHSGRAEIGYTVFEPFRGRGLATEACAALTAWAFEQGERAVFLSIRPDNAASLAIAKKLGYLEVGSQDDPEDGLELVFERKASEAGFP